MGYGDASDPAHVIPMLAPLDVEALTVHTAPIDGGECVHIQFVVVFGWLNVGGTLTVEECDDNVPTTVVATARWHYRQSAAIGTDLWGPSLAGAAGGVAVGILDMRTTYLIDIEPRRLTAGFPYVRVTFTDGGMGGGKLSDWMAILAVVTPRYTQTPALSVLN